MVSLRQMQVSRGSGSADATVALHPCAPLGENGYDIRRALASEATDCGCHPVAGALLSVLGCVFLVGATRVK